MTARVQPNYLDGFLAAAGASGATRQEEKPPLLPVPPQAESSFEERVKRELHPLDAFPRLLACAQSNRPPGPDDQFRFQWFGLFYQGPQQDAFRLRLRLPGGRLQAFQLAGLAEITQEFAAGSLECNALGGVDIPGVPVRAATEILRRVEEIGLRTLLTGGDCVRAVRGGGPGEEVIYPLVRELEQALALNRKLTDLPRECEVVLRGSDDHLPELREGNGAATDDAITFQARSISSDAETFSLGVPGGEVPGLELTRVQVVPTCLALLNLWADGGDRSDRQRASLANFCAAMGYERLRMALVQTLEPPPALSAPGPAEPTADRRPLARVLVPDGRLLSGVMARLAALAQAEGSGEAQLATGQLFLPRAPDQIAIERALRKLLNRS